MWMECSLLDYDLHRKIFNALADALEWCIAMEGVEGIFHYLDDFAIIGPPDSDICALHLNTLVRIC